MSGWLFEHGVYGRPPGVSIGPKETPGQAARDGARYLLQHGVELSQGDIAQLTYGQIVVTTEDEENYFTVVRKVEA